jgi:methionine-rich copper-binding protein CopC
MTPHLRALLVILLWLPAGLALAHSELRSAKPANGTVLAEPPQAIELQFNENVQVTALRLYRDGGGEVAIGRARALDSVRSYRQPLPALEPGSYRVEWRIISADGHPVGGVIRFRVGGRP